ncbi:MAG: hypothetical protein CAPSK01_001888 [Candidatus Accumulibacter vicinus]|uniref:Uncharacterized protein n=1 Tax=Candidatus Accumulibacter vicinus TaxID=2954382 RepID=A0A084Y198_9PROT|nr:MAG: hypothetical protein CAPSK01_001888 [Candidatus Accumulibacter vicinus]
MDVVLRRARQFKVDDVRQFVNVEAARGNVGGDQHQDRTLLESFERLQALLLALVAMDRVGGNPGLLQFAGEPVGFDLGAGEHQHLIEIGRLQEFDQQRALGLGRHRVDAVGDRLGHGVAPGHFDQHRRLEHAVGQFLDLFRERRREQQALPLPGQQVDDARDVGDEAHVEHSIRLIEHERLHAGEVEALLFKEIEQPAGGRHQHLDSTADLGDLRLDVDPPENATTPDRNMPAVGLDRLVHLDRQFARWRQHQHPYRMARG